MGQKHHWAILSYLHRLRDIVLYKESLCLFSYLLQQAIPHNPPFNYTPHLPPRLTKHCYSFFVNVFLLSLFSSSSILLLLCCYSEGPSTTWTGDSLKKRHHCCHKGQSHQLWNIHHWLGKCDGTVMTGGRYSPRPPYPTPHSAPTTPALLSIRAEGRWTFWICITRKMYWFFIWRKRTHKNHITWNCHSSSVHSSSLLMFGFCHKLCLITRYSKLQSLSP